LDKSLPCSTSVSVSIKISENSSLVWHIRCSTRM
jgi:hypothetical protein